MKTVAHFVPMEHQAIARRTCAKEVHSNAEMAIANKQAAGEMAR